jgi:hypothetical protein
MKLFMPAQDPPLHTYGLRTDGMPVKFPGLEWQVHR